MKFLIGSLLLISILVGCGGEAPSPKVISLVAEPGTQTPSISIVEPTVSPTLSPTVVLPTSIPTPIPTLAPPTPTPISIPVSPTPILPTPTPIPTGPQEGDLTPDSRAVYKDGAWNLLPTPTPILPLITPTPTPVPQYGVVASAQIPGTPDKLDFSSGPTVASSKLSFSSTYTSRDLGTPTVVQLWQRNGHVDAVTSDANDNGCSTQKPMAFYRIAPARGMKYAKSVEENYVWSYCINEYRFKPTSLNIPWVNSTSWTYNTQGVLETFVFEGSTTGLVDAFNPPGKWVAVIFAGNTILSETIIP